MSCDNFKCVNLIDGECDQDGGECIGDLCECWGRVSELPEGNGFE